MPTIKLSEKCDRCPREELVEATLEEAVQRVKGGDKRQKALEVALDGKLLVSYRHLCDECRAIVIGYCDGTRKQTKKSARRVKKLPTEKPVKSASQSAARSH